MASASNFAASVQKILKEYQDDIVKDTGKLVKKLGQKGAKEVKSASGQFGGSGKYAAGWTSQYEETRLAKSATIYNRTAGLPHLLENGHALRNGGRVAGRTHIAPVEQELIEEFTKAIEGIV